MKITGTLALTEEGRKASVPGDPSKCWIATEIRKAIPELKDAQVIVSIKNKCMWIDNDVIALDDLTLSRLEAYDKGEAVKPFPIEFSSSQRGKDKLIDERVDLGRLEGPVYVR